jgi:DNA-binding GntR family transcriptional regulator
VTRPFLEDHDVKSIKPKKTLTEETYKILLHAICTGELEPGERLSQDRIAAKLKVSRQPVNSAISILKANQFVEDTGRRGVVVAPFDPSLFRSIFEYRSVIEPFAVTLAAARLKKPAGREAGEILSRGTRAAHSGDMRAMLQSDIEFHEMILGWSGNSVIQSSMRVNWHHIRRSMAQVLRDPETAIPVWKQHEEIVENVLSGNAEIAASHMKAHIEKAYQRIISEISGGAAAEPIHA